MLRKLSMTADWSTGALRTARKLILNQFLNTATFLTSSPDSSIGVSAMKAAWASRGSFNKRRNGSNPMVPSPICWCRSSFDPQAALASLKCQT